MFKLDAAGKETLLYSFTGLSDGANPGSGLTLDREGDLYGTTVYGGDLSNTADPCDGFGCGVVFKIALNNKCDHDQEHGQAMSGVKSLGWWVRSPPAPSSQLPPASR